MPCPPLSAPAHYAGHVPDRRDDDALSWDGDDDPTLDTGATGDDTADDVASPHDPVDTDSAREPAPTGPTQVLPDGFTAVGKGSAAIASADDHAAPERESAQQPAEDEAQPAMGSAQLVALGILGGVYALFAIGWLIGGLRLQGWRPFLVTDAMYQGSLWLAALAPVLWFATVFLLTRTTRAWVRFAWLAAGVVVLVPWPFVMIGAVGQ